MAENLHVDCSEPQWDVNSSGTFSGETRAVSVNRLQLQSKYTIETTLWGSFTDEGLLNLTDASDLQWRIATSDIHDETRLFCVVDCFLVAWTSAQICKR